MHLIAVKRAPSLCLFDTSTLLGNEWLSIGMLRVCSWEWERLRRRRELHSLWFHLARSVVAGSSRSDRYLATWENNDWLDVITGDQKLALLATGEVFGSIAGEYFEGEGILFSGNWKGKEDFE